MPSEAPVAEPAIPPFSTDLDWQGTPYGHVYRVTATGQKVATVWGTQAQKKANSNLWCASPKLLDAARKFLANVTLTADGVVKPVSLNELTDAYNAFVVAVAQAEGRP